MDWTDYGAALFDLDGVITPTAEVHMRAWARMFSAYLPDDVAPYTDDDYFRYVDGKPRYDGVRSLLESRGITLPEGTPDDAPDAETVCSLGNRKNVVFNEVLAAEGIAPYPGSLRLVEQLHAQGFPMAIVSSSKNAPDVLEQAGVAHFFPVVVHGGVSAEKGLRGKPAPDTYEYGAELLGVPTQQAIVFEDALSGVEAGAAGDFALVVGVDRGVGADQLTQHGADVVVSDLAELL